MEIKIEKEIGNIGVISWDNWDIYPENPSLREYHYVAYFWYQDCKFVFGSFTKGLVETLTEVSSGAAAVNMEHLKASSSDHPAAIEELLTIFKNRVKRCPHTMPELVAGYVTPINYIKPEFELWQILSGMVFPNS